jgi:myo-inositol-1(or 4)-monophosphatase
MVKGFSANTTSAVAARFRGTNDLEKVLASFDCFSRVHIRMNSFVNETAVRNYRPVGLFKRHAMHPALNIMVKAARRASQIINRAAQDIERIGVAPKKHNNDFVTEVDKTAEAAIIGILREAYPDYGILAEESGVSSASENGKDYQWVIDPLDGTTNFIHGFPQYAVSIALTYKGQPNQAVVYDVMRNELFTASKGGGAYLNDRRIRVTRRDRMEHALLGTGFPFRYFEHIDPYLAVFKDLTRRAAGIRRAGSAALDLAYVACGRFDGFWEFGVFPWDIAAGCLLITEAGGLVSDLAGGDGHLKTGNVVAGTPKIFAQILQVIDSHRTPALQA